MPNFPRSGSPAEQVSWLDEWIRDDYVDDWGPYLVRLCSWCRTVLGLKPGNGQTGISHSICDECLRKIREGTQ